LTYKILFDKKVVKDLKKISQKDRERIVGFIEKNLSHDPYIGKKLAGDLSDFYRYRLGKYRIVYTIEEDEILVEVVRVGHRKEIYEKLKR